MSVVLVKTLWRARKLVTCASRHPALGATHGIAAAGSPEPLRSGGAGPAALRGAYACIRHDFSDS